MVASSTVDSSCTRRLVHSLNRKQLKPLNPRSTRPTTVLARAMVAAQTRRARGKAEREAEREVATPHPPINAQIK